MTSLSKLVTTSLEVSRSGGQEMTRGPGWDKIGVEEQFFRKLEFHDGRNQVPIFEVPQENHDGTTRKFICFLMGESV